MEQAQSEAPRVHLFDEPQFNTQDGYIGFMLDFFRKLRAEGRLVFLCLHPNEPWHLRDPARGLRALRVRRRAAALDCSARVVRRAGRRRSEAGRAAYSRCAGPAAVASAAQR